jgi:hypothetical protein
VTHDRPRDVQDWLRRLSPEQAEQVEWLTGTVHAAGDGLDEAVKWKRLTFTAGGDWHHWLCAVGVSARGVSLVFHKGSLLDDPAGVLEGDARYTRQLPYERVAGKPGVVTALVRAAMARQTDMLDDR